MITPSERSLRSRSPGDPENAPISSLDEAVVEAQLGRAPRSIHAVGHRCPCGNPDVVTTEPRLDDGTPFPTTYYLTCPRAASLIGTLEAEGLMREMSERVRFSLQSPLGCGRDARRAGRAPPV